MILKNTWFRLIAALFGMVVSVILIDTIIDQNFIEPKERQLQNARRGISQSEQSIKTISRDIDRLTTKINKKIGNSQLKYQHYYTMSNNPVLYINQFVLTQSKPETLLISNSSVITNASLSVKLKRLFRPNVNNQNIKHMRNFSNFYQISSLRLSASGTFFDVGQFLTNIYNLPLSFYVSDFSILNNNNFVDLKMTIIFITFRDKR